MKTKNKFVPVNQSIMGDDEMKRLTYSVYTFEKLIKYDYLYIDKTEYVWRLMQEPDAMYFLSRPRRFGKSLLVSTLKAVFEGKRELFQGLAINDKPYDWKTFPVIHLDFVNCDSRTSKELQAYLEHLLEVSAETLGLKLRGEGPAVRFENLISDAAKSSAARQAVILIDEYDKPILSNIEDKLQDKDLLPVLKGFYSSIKKCSTFIRLAFITGVSKFSHVTLFSNLNNLNDITLEPDYAEMLGFTEEEIRRNFAEVIPDAARENGLEVEPFMAELLKWYDGYRFSRADTHVCNPVSIMSFFDSHYDLSGYWDSTGTPSFLIKEMQRRSYNLGEALEDWYGKEIFSAYELDSLDLTGLLWQTGYLTIRDVRHGARGTEYRLGFPDVEVSETFCRRLLGMYANLSRGLEYLPVKRLAEAIRAEDPEGFLRGVQAVTANIKYEMHIQDEKYYQTIFFVSFFLLGGYIEAESHSNVGSLDAYVRTAKTVYIFEFKLNRTAEKAVGQIIDRRYYEKFRLCGLPVRLFGVNFDYSQRNITAWKELPLPE